MILGNKFIQAFPAPVRKALKPFLIGFFRKAEKRRLTALYAGLVRPGDLVFDVGAHTGAMADILLSLGVKVVCIDPQPACVEALREKFRGNASVSLEAVGVGAEPGELEFSICADGPQTSTFSEKWQQGRFASYRFDEKVLVPVATLDALIEKHGRPAFCKIDVEGYEPQVLRGLTRPVPCVSFEFTREFFEDAETCLRHLESLSPCVFNVSLYNQYRFALPAWCSARELTVFLKNHPADDLCGDIYCRSQAA